MGEWGERIRKWRVDVVQLSQMELAAHLGTHHGSISQWENGVVRVPPDKGDKLMAMSKGVLTLEDMGYTTNNEGEIGYYIFRRVEWGKLTRSPASLENLTKARPRRLGGPSYASSREEPSREPNLDESGTPVDDANQEDEDDEPTETNVTHRKL